tara:strand:+ start:83 stop:454 length:372 start_codon:yes stop_codon:yes gene_type:complete
MPNLFGIDIAGEIAKAFSGLLLKGTLTKTIPGTRTPGNLTGGNNPTSVPYSFEGFIENKTEVRKGGTLVSSGGKMVSILGGSLPAGIVPASADEVTIEGTTYKILAIEGRDPAAALYECRVEV